MIAAGANLVRSLPVATLHRLTGAEARRLGLAVPSYATVRAIVQDLDPALVTLALEGPAAYRDRHELDGAGDGWCSTSLRRWRSLNAT